MSQDVFIEDVFLRFSDAVMFDSEIDSKDYNVIDRFAQMIRTDRPFTKAQGNLLITILKKYRNILDQENIKYQDAIADPRWKNEFRILDHSKKAEINFIDDIVSVILKFPYAFKKTYEEEFLKVYAPELGNTYSYEKQVNILPLHTINLIVLNEFLNKHNFEFNESFLDALSIVEDIWEDQENICPRSYIDEGSVKLLNSNKDADTFFEKNRTGIIDDDLFLAKQMGYILSVKDNSNLTTFEKVVSLPHSQFWTDDFSKFFDVAKRVTGKSIVILDRTDKTREWIEIFIAKGLEAGINEKFFKICFREEGQDNEFNQWVRDNNYGQNVRDGRFLIFKHKIAKWLISSEENVKIVVSNSLFPVTHHFTQRWIDGQNCVFYIGEVKAAQIKGNEIVSL